MMKSKVDHCGILYHSWRANDPYFFTTYKGLYKHETNKDIHGGQVSWLDLRAQWQTKYAKPFTRRDNDS